MNDEMFPTNFFKFVLTILQSLFALLQAYYDDALDET